METIFMNTENSKTNEAQKFVLNLSQILDLSSDRHDTLQQKSEVLYTFTLNKFYAYLLNVEPSNLVFLKTYNAEFDEIIITFTDQNGRPLENGR